MSPVGKLASEISERRETVRPPHRLTARSFIRDDRGSRTCGPPHEIREPSLRIVDIPPNQRGPQCEKALSYSISLFSKKRLTLPLLRGSVSAKRVSAND